MFQQLLNWRTLLGLVAILIVSGTIWYSSYLASKIAGEEREKVATIAETLKIQNQTTESRMIIFAQRLIRENNDIPIIETNERDEPSGLYSNLDSALVASDSLYLNKKIREFKKQHNPVITEISSNPVLYNKYYYGDSRLLAEVRYYPLIQLFIVGLFIIITLFSIRSRNRATQNQVWAGMAKETAHQLGTPVSSLEGWVEILKESHAGEPFVAEVEKDVSRLRLVSDRFGKIGSKPQLEERNIVAQVASMVEYIRKRAGGKVKFELDTGGHENIPIRISAPLFDWVIENLMKNGLDAMEGKGLMRISMQDSTEEVVIDVKDTGKGISKTNLNKVFKPGFTTKKRGWGLGLSLSKRIIEQYHRGQLIIKSSEPGKGTTFRITLKK